MNFKRFKRYTSHNISRVTIQNHLKLFYLQQDSNTIYIYHIIFSVLDVSKSYGNCYFAHTKKIHDCLNLISATNTNPL